MLSEYDQISSIPSKSQCSKKPAGTLCTSQAQKVLMIEWLPGENLFNRETGKHKHRKLACGHLSCTLASEEGGCVECKEAAAKAEEKRLAEEESKEG